LADSVNQLPVRVLAIIVLYKLKPRDSVTFNTLQASISGLKQGQADIKILLYDNTPGGQDTGVLPANAQYKADLDNGGLAKAYNYALGIAHEEGIDWLLTLDQDTSLPVDFASKLCHAAAFVAPLSMVAAIVPIVSGGGRVMTPWIFTKHWPLMKRLPNGFVGISMEKTYAANSASTIRVSALKTIGGYDPRFPLDYSDLVMYHRLHANNFRIFVAGNIFVEQELSFLDLKNRSTPDRYESGLLAEEAFYDEYLGKVQGMVQLFRNFYRLVYKLWRMGGTVVHLRITLRFLCRRLFYSRKHRVESWKRSVIRRSAASPDISLNS
jgi:GT2 family glycosyltransferase